MVTILGAGGVIADELIKEIRGKERIRVVSRHPKPTSVAETVTADISDLKQTIDAVSGSEVVYLLVGLKYDIAVWRELWPRIMQNAIEACKRAQAKLIFFDNVYMYGKVDGAMTEQTPFNPCSGKGEIRAQIATALLCEMKAGSLTAMVARSADFYGPAATNGVPNVLVFDRIAHGKSAYWLANDSVRHSFTFTPDAAKALAMLAGDESAWNQTWHLPAAANPLTGKQFIDLVAGEFGAQSRHRVLTGPMIRVSGWFNKTVAELHEMLYQYDREYLFDSTKFSTAFGFEATSYADGIRTAANGYKAHP